MDSEISRAEWLVVILITVAFVVAVASAVITLSWIPAAISLAIAFLLVFFLGSR